MGRYDAKSRIVVLEVKLSNVGERKQWEVVEDINLADADV